MNHADISQAARISHLERLLRIAYPYLVDMQAAAVMTHNQHGTDASGDELDRIRGLCAEVAREIGE